MLEFLKRLLTKEPKDVPKTRPGEPTKKQKAKDYEVLQAAEQRKKSRMKQDAEILKQSPKSSTSQKTGTIPNPFRSNLA